jgi:hypothetical protein
MVDEPPPLGPGITLADLELLRLCRFAQAADLREDRLPDLTDWNIRPVQSFSWKAPFPENIPLPEGFRPHSHHAGPRGVTAVVFVRTSLEDGGITNVVIAYREDTRAYGQDDVQQTLRGYVANEIATAVRDQLVKRKSIDGPILTGWHMGGQTALLASLDQERIYPVVAFNPPLIPSRYVRFFRQLFKLPDSSVRERLPQSHYTVVRRFFRRTDDFEYSVKIRDSPQEGASIAGGEKAIWRDIRLDRDTPDERLHFAEGLGPNQRRRRSPKIRAAAKAAVVTSKIAPVFACCFLLWHIPGAICLATAVVTRRTIAAVLSTWASSRDSGKSSQTSTTAPSHRKHQSPLRELVGLRLRRAWATNTAMPALEAANHIVTAHTVGGRSGSAATVTAVCVGTIAGIVSKVIPLRQERPKHKSSTARSKRP